MSRRSFITRNATAAAAAASAFQAQPLSKLVNQAIRFPSCLKVPVHRDLREADDAEQEARLRRGHGALQHHVDAGGNPGRGPGDAEGEDGAPDALVAFYELGEGHYFQMMPLFASIVLNAETLVSPTTAGSPDVVAVLKVWMNEPNVT